jgi:hypothetical protein
MDAGATDVAVLSLAAAADLASTHVAMQRGAVELNPLMREPAAAFVFKAATVAGTAALCSELRDRGHSRAAKVARWVVAGVWLGIAANNVRVARSLP